jgi:hypothetical protein
VRPQPSIPSPHPPQCKATHRAQYVQLPAIPQSKARFVACLYAKKHAVRMRRLSLVFLRFVPASVFPAQRQPCHKRAASRPCPRSLCNFTTGIPSTDGSYATLKVAHQSHHSDAGLISAPRAHAPGSVTRWPLLCTRMLSLCSPPRNWRLARHKILFLL